MALGLGLGLVALVSGCGTPRTTDEAAPQRFVEAPTVAENARQRFGDRAEQAYRELAKFSIDEWLKPGLVDPGAPAPSAGALSEGIVDHLDPATVPHWQNSVTAALQGNADEVSTVRMLRFFNLQAPTLRMPDGGKSPITGEGVTEGVVGLGQVRTDGIYPLVVTFRQRARLDLMSGRSPSVVMLRKKVTFTVIPIGEPAPSSTPSGAAGTNQSATDLAPTPPATAPVTPASALASTAAIPTGSTTRDPSVRWLITTFEGDIAVTDSIDDSGSGSESPTTGGTSSTNPAVPAPTTSRVLAR